MNKHKADLFLLCIILGISFIGLILIKNLVYEKGSTVEIIVDNKVEKILNLNKDTEYTQDIMNDYNIIKIKDKKVSIIESNCKNQICVNHVSISKVGETIICLPHSLIVKIAN